MTLHAPQIIFLALMFTGWGIGLAQHGSPKTGEHSIFVDVISSLIMCGLLYWGGFFG